MAKLHCFNATDLPCYCWRQLLKFANSCQYSSVTISRDSHIFQKSTSHLKIPGSRRVTSSKLHMRTHRYEVLPYKCSRPFDRTQRFVHPWRYLRYASVTTTTITTINTTTTTTTTITTKAATTTEPGGSLPPSQERRR